MIDLLWIKSVFKRKKEISYDLDKSKEGIIHLVELTKRLDEMELDVRRHEEFLNAVVNSLDTPMWVKDTKGRFLFLNAACANKILKTTVDAAMNFTDTDFENDALANVCVTSDKKVQKSLGSRRFIEHARYPDYDLWIDVVKSPLFIGNELFGVVGLATDVTERIPKELKDRFNQAGAVEIAVDLKYCTDEDKRGRMDHIENLLENAVDDSK